MAVSERQMERTIRYTNLVFELLRDKLGNEYDINAERTRVAVRHKVDYIVGSISIREENVWYGFGGNKRGGNGKLYIVVDTPKYHGKVFKETKKNFEKQFERAVNYLVTDIKNEQKEKNVRETRRQVFDKAQRELAEKLGIDDYFHRFHPQVRNRIKIVWDRHTDKHYPTVEFDISVVNIGMDKVEEAAHKILNLLLELEQ